MQKMRTKNDKTEWALWAVTLSYLALNYNPQALVKSELPLGWIFSLLASILIILIYRRAYKSSWKEELGLTLSKAELFLYPAFFLGTTAILYIFFIHTTRSAGYFYSPSILFHTTQKASNFILVEPSRLLPHYLYHIPQTFNDEMVIGAIALFLLERKAKHVPTTILAAAVALIFSLAHYLFYLISPLQQGTIFISTMFSLFAVGFIRNYLILTTRKIYAAWILHASFNLLFFPAYYLKEGSKVFLAGDANKLNLLLGSSTALALCMAAACLILILTKLALHFKRRAS